MEYEVHEAALTFPLVEGEELKQLALDIQANGLLDPIVVYEGKILDGRNRLRACEMVGVEPTFRELEPDAEDFDPLVFVVSKNLHRRHLTPAQKAALALTLMPYLTEEARERKSVYGRIGGLRAVGKDADESTESLPEKGTAAEKAAQFTGAGISAVNTAIAVQKRNPKLIKKMLSGELNVTQAARAVGLRGKGEMYQGDHLASNDTDVMGRVVPIYYGKGDKWRESIGPLVRYLNGWEKKGFEFRHVNPKEARKRLATIAELKEKLSAAEADLEQRAHSATLTMKAKG